MGSFAYTCTVSGLPIEAGDKVLYLMLTKNPYYKDGENTCYSTDIWSPRTPPLLAEYNDYGSVENVEEGLMRDLWLQGLQLDLIEQGVGENSVHDVPTPKTMTFDELLIALVEGRILVDRNFEPRPSLRMGLGQDFRELEELLARIDPDFIVSKQWNEPVSHKIPVPLAVSHAMIRKDVWDALLTGASWQGMLQSLFEGGADHIIGMFRNFSLPSVGIGTHIDLLVREQKTIPESLVKVLAEFSVIHARLSRCRYQWRPSSGAGPQFGEWREHANLLAALQRVARSNARKKS